MTQGRSSHPGITVIPGSARTAWYVALMTGAILYVYRFVFLGINITPFRMVYLAWAGCVVSGLVTLRLRFRKTLIPFTALGLVLLAVNLVDVLRMSSPQLYGRDAASHMLNLSIVFLFVLSIRTEEHLNRFIKVFAGMSVLAFAIAVYAAALGEIPFEAFLRAHTPEALTVKGFVIRHLDAVRLSSAFFDPNFYGLYLCIVMVFCFYAVFFLAARGRYWCLLGLALGALVFTMSKSAMAGTAVAMLMTFVQVPRARPALLVLGFVVAVCLIGIAASAPYSPVLGSVLDRFLDPTSALSRIVYMANGLDAFVNHPFLGGGTEGLVSPDTEYPSAHMVYLTWLAKYGIVGFVAYAAFLFWPMLHALAAGRLLAARFRYLIVTLTMSLSVIYLAYDHFALLEFQYLAFGVMYAIVVNRLGLSAGARGMARPEAARG